MSTDRPPQFLQWEVVRIARATGYELDAHDDPFDVTPLLGQDAVVLGAAPTHKNDGWLVHGFVESLGDIVSFPEDALESTGLEDVRDRPGESRRGPLDTSRRWRDDVLIDLRTGPLTDADAEDVARAAAAVLAAVEGVDEVDWELLPEQNDENRWLTLWAWSDGDALQAYGRILALTPRLWQHRNDEKRFMLSYWKPKRGSQFLVPEAFRAAVTYRRLTSPERRSRDDILPT